MANIWHVKWLAEGVSRWNKRRKRVDFIPDLTGIRFFDQLPPDYRDEPKTSRYFEKLDLSNAKLSGTDLSDLNFSRANFTDADLRGANLSKSNFENAKFLRANLTRANGTRAVFKNAYFENSQVMDFKINHSEIDGAIFIQTDLSKEQRKIIGDQRVRIYASRSEFSADERISIDIGDQHYSKSVSLGEQDDRTRKAKYDVYYGTTRKPIIDRGAITGFDGVGQSDLSFGLCEVIVPEGHRIGGIGSRLWKWLRNRKDSALTLDSIIPLNEDLFWSHLIHTADKMQEKARPTVFIHGYNTSFEEAVLRAAQIGYDLGIGQGIGLFSWASKGKPLQYSADESTVENSKYPLVSFLEKFVSEGSNSGINIIAHSMGCRCLLGALEILAERRSEILKHIHQVILAAADVDTKLMSYLAPHAVKYTTRTTSYVSDKDRALKLSGWHHSFPRVGITPPTYVFEGMDTILVNDLEPSDFLSHAYVAKNRLVLSDMHAILKNGLAPDLRHGLEAGTWDSKPFWKFRP